MPIAFVVRHVFELGRPRAKSRFGASPAGHRFHRAGRLAKGPKRTVSGKCTSSLSVSIKMTSTHTAPRKCRRALSS